MAYQWLSNHPNSFLNHHVICPDKKYMVTLHLLGGQIQVPTMSNLLQNYSLILKKDVPLLIKAKLLGVTLLLICQFQHEHILFK